MTALRIAILFAIFSPSVAQAAGLASNDNFIVLTPAQPSEREGQKFAERMLDEAGKFRAEFAKEWLGEELQTGSGKSIISVTFDDGANSALTWAKDHPSRRYHNVYLKTSRENALGGTLHHELAHTVMATRYPEPNRLPPWVEEGIASRYDIPVLIAVRQQEVLSWLRIGRAPQLIPLLMSTNIASFDDTQYATAESLVSFLLTRGDAQTVIRFAADGQLLGWDAALQTHYQIDDVGQLQIEWQDWLVSSSQ